jgi:hypothetical protein
MNAFRGLRSVPSITGRLEHARRLVLAKVQDSPPETLSRRGTGSKLSDPVKGEPVGAAVVSPKLLIRLSCCFGIEFAKEVFYG